jgi:tetratricopeptide (TPR) repeat protein
MTKLVPIRPVSLRSLIDKHKTEIHFCGQIFVGVYLLYFTIAFWTPWAASAFTAGSSALIIWGFFYVAMALLSIVLGVKLVVTGALQIVILKSLKSMQFARSKRLCLKGIGFLKHWPLVRGAEVTFFEVGLGTVCMGRADYSEAESLYASCVDRYRRHMRRFRFINKAVNYSNMVILLSQLSRAYAAQDRFDEAEKAAGEALEYARSIGKRAYLRVEIFPLSAMGYTHLRSGALEEAENEYKMVFKVHEETPQMPANSSTAFVPTLMAAKLGLAQIAMKKGDKDQSLKYWSDFKVMESQSETAKFPGFLRGFNLLANEYMNYKLYAEAENVLDTAYSLAMLHFDHPDAKETLDYYEKLMFLTGRQAEVGEMRAWLRLTQQEPHRQQPD